nr:MAG TPA: hypothetical protein [Caudoviricetes sp.]
MLIRKNLPLIGIKKELKIQSIDLNWVTVS